MPLATGTITAEWGDGEYPFRLGIGELREIERKTSAGILELYDKIVNRKWRLDDLREVIRNGLIGGGMQPKEANALVKRYVDERPLMESVPVADAMLLYALIGPPRDEPKKATAEGAVTGASPSADSMKTAPPSDSAPAKSTQ